MVSPIVIAGPTASGKSTLAINIAEKIGGELICADSRQVFAHMSVGTAGPSADDRARVPHHGFGVVDPNGSYDAGQFIVDTDRYVDEVTRRMRVPILVGGTGLYLRAWRYGLSDVPARDDKIRASLCLEKDQKGLAHLFSKLKDVDVDAADQIGPNDEVRIIRALEIYLSTQKKPSELRQSHSRETPRRQANWILLFPHRDWLMSRIRDRVAQMFEGGLVDEALALRGRIHENALLHTMGYEEALLYADGHLTKNEAVVKAEIRHRQYAKRQLTWFKKETWWTQLNPSTDNLFAQVLDILDS